MTMVLFIGHIFDKYLIISHAFFVAFYAEKQTFTNEVIQSYLKLAYLHSHTHCCAFWDLYFVNTYSIIIYKIKRERYYLNHGNGCKIWKLEFELADNMLI